MPKDVRTDPAALAENDSIASGRTMVTPKSPAVDVVAFSVTPLDAGSVTSMSPESLLAITIAAGGTRTE